MRMGEIILNTRDNTLDVSEVPILAGVSERSCSRRSSVRVCCWCRPCRPSLISSMIGTGTTARPTGASGPTTACPSHTGAVWSRTSSRSPDRPVGTGRYALLRDHGLPARGSLGVSLRRLAGARLCGRGGRVPRGSTQKFNLSFANVQIGTLRHRPCGATSLDTSVSMVGYARSHFITATRFS